METTSNNLLLESQYIIILIMHNGVKSFMKSKAEISNQLWSLRPKNQTPSDFPRYFLSKKSFQSTYLDIINSPKSREITVFFKYEIECDSKRKMAPLLNHNHYHPLGKKEKSFLSMFCVCYHTKTSSIMSANLRVGISIRPLALYTKVILPGLAK